MLNWLQTKKKYFSSSGSGGLTMYWMIVIGVIVMSGYMVGGLIPTRTPRLGNGQQLSYKPPTYKAGMPVLQLGSMLIGGCQGLPGVLFLIDSSDSMLDIPEGSNSTKLDLVKTAILTFTSRLTDQAVVGVITYSSPNAGDPQVLFNFAELGKNKTAFSDVISGLGAGGLTYFREGVELSRVTLDTAIKIRPDYKYNLIVISDGIPETALCQDNASNPGCVCKPGTGTTCFAGLEDPNLSPSVAQAIRDLNVTISVVGIQSLIPAEDAYKSEYETMLSTLASQPSSKHYLMTPSATNLSEIFNKMGGSLCLENENAPDLATPTPTPSPTPSPTPTVTPTPTRPATPTPTKPASQPAPAADIMLVIDNSNSMKQRIGDVRTAATSFINTIAGNTSNSVGVATFDENPGAIRQGLTRNYPAAISGLSNFGIGGKNGTCLECALDSKNNNDVLYQFQNFSSNPRKVLIIFTDGQVNRWLKDNGEVTGGSNPDNPAGKKKAHDQAKAALARIPATDIWVIDYTNSGTMNDFVKGRGQYYNAANANITTIYQTIANNILH